MSQMTAMAGPAFGSPILGWAENPKSSLQLTGAEAPLTLEEQNVLAYTGHSGNSASASTSY